MMWIVVECAVAIEKNVDDMNMKLITKCFALLECWTDIVVEPEASSLLCTQ